MNLSINEIGRIFSHSGATVFLAKPLAENDNSKQQIYLGSSFKVLSEIPFGEVTSHGDVVRPNFKAKVNFYWLTQSGGFEKAEHAQLIFYPDYPEVRLSGFLLGCSSAPSQNMRPIPKENRGPKNKWDGRVLFLGITPDGKVLAHLATKGSAASNEFESFKGQGKAVELPHSPVLYTVATTTFLSRDASSEELLIRTLSGIHHAGWHKSARLNKQGEVVPYSAPNGGGYTLEALLGIIPNGRSEPDFMGWEVKACGGNRVTLMTPEPDAGLYGVEGAEAFLRKYGYVRADGAIYFTGQHKTNICQKRTGQTLSLAGFEPATGTIVDVSGGIHLTDKNGELAAAWSFSRLIEHWGRKHAQAVYVPYRTQKFEGAPQYEFLSPVHLGTGTDLPKYLCAMHDGFVFYDPAPKLEPIKNSVSYKVKARSQFRISKKKLHVLYQHFKARELV